MKLGILDLPPERLSRRERALIADPARMTLGDYLIIEQLNPTINRIVSISQLLDRIIERPKDELAFLEEL